MRRVTDLFQTRLKNGARRLRRGVFGVSDYDETIPPEIVDDAFYEAIRSTARAARITTALEIGSSSGEGSTKAFVEGLHANHAKPRLFCIELSVPRFNQLQQRYAGDPQVICYNLTSVPADRLPTERQVTDFYREKETKLNLVPLHEVLRWLHQDVLYLARAGNAVDGIAKIKRENGIDRFGMVLIDGSEFTGSAELEEVYGADFILLDDIGTFKNHANHELLLSDPAYRLLQKDETLRNGFSVFERVARD